MLYRRFPIFAKQVATDARRVELLALPTLTAGQAAELARLEIAPEESLACDIEMRPVIIATGLGELGNEDFETGVSKRLSEEEQKAVAAVVMRLSNPTRGGTRAIGLNGSPLFLVHRDPETGDIEHAWAGIAGRDGIKPQTWYTLSKEGRPYEVPAGPLPPGPAALDNAAAAPETNTPKL